jgi:hypothetical protein
VYAGKIAGLGYFPDGNERTFVEVDGLDLRVHMRMETADCRGRSDESRSM